jgi:hypothetical protein
VDPCGEHGEYHTCVTHAPLFSSAVPVKTGEFLCHHGCWALDVTVDEHVERGLQPAPGEERPFPDAGERSDASRL